MCFLCAFEAQMQQDACLCAQCMRALHAAVYVPMSVQNSWKSMVSESFVSHSFIIFCRSSSSGFSPNDSRTARSSSLLIVPLPSCEAI